MKARGQFAHRRPILFGALAIVAAAAVAIPVASGASAHAKLRPSALHQSKLVIAPSVLKENGPGPKPGHGSTCAGGSIAPGTYSSLKITGFCTVDQGVVTVQHDLTVAPNAGLLAAFGGGPQLVVGGNLKVQTNGVLVLGCEPGAFVCFNDPDQDVGTLSSKEAVFGNLDAHNALAVLVHDTAVGHDLRLHGGGGGVNCNPQEALQGSPAYATFEDVSVGHNADINGFQSCWLGFIRVTVQNDVKFQNNVMADPDGNEVTTDIVNGNLDCHGNNPAAQVGESQGTLDIVLGHATGECKALVSP